MRLVQQRIGRFELLEHLASGGMADVYLARIVGVGGFERRVVIKALSMVDEDQTLVSMFLDEARLAAALHHQFIAPIYEVGCDDDGRFYFVMDYVPGATVQAVWKSFASQGRKVPMSFALTVGAAIASALEYTHAACAPDGTPLEIVHRDISPSNVLVGHDGSVKLIDFGIAKSAKRMTRTQRGVLKGKIGYLAPEQILQHPVDRRSDIFALGVVLYELTTTTRAFNDKSDLITMERVIHGEIARPSNVVAGYPPALEAIVMTALQVAPGDRYQDAGDIARALESFAHDHGIVLGHSAVARTVREAFVKRPSAPSDSWTDISGPPGSVDLDVTPVTAILGRVDDSPTGPVWSS